MGKKWLGIASVVTLMGVSARLARAQDTRRPVDPVTLQRAVADNPDFDIASLWQRMAIPTQLDTVYRKIGIKPLNPDATFDSCSNDCAAEITRANLDADPAEEVILKVYQRWGFCRFLVFKPSGTAAPVGWQFVGYADHDSQDITCRTIGLKCLAASVTLSSRFKVHPELESRSSTTGGTKSNRRASTKF
jgi:hypothetical protein